MNQICPLKMSHVVYRTRQFERLLGWYQLVFCTRMQYRSETAAFVTFDDEHHRFAFFDLSKLLQDGDDKDRPGAVGVDHIAYSLASLRDLLEKYAELRDVGILPYWCVHHGISISLYYADPDNNQVEFQVDSFATSADASAFIRDHFDANPVGVEFDPGVWLARLRGGVPESEFLRRRIHLPVSQVRSAVPHRR